MQPIHRVRNPVHYNHRLATFFIQCKQPSSLVILFSKLNQLFLGYAGPRFVFIVKINDFRGDLTSVAVLAEISLRSPRKVFNFIIERHTYRMKVSKNKLTSFWNQDLHWTWLVFRLKQKHWSSHRWTITRGIYSTTSSWLPPSTPRSSERSYPSSRPPRSRRSWAGFFVTRISKCSRSATFSRRKQPRWRTRPTRIWTEPASMRRNVLVSACSNLPRG